LIFNARRQSLISFLSREQTLDTENQIPLSRVQQPSQMEYKKFSIMGNTVGVKDGFAGGFH